MEKTKKFGNMDYIATIDTKSLLISTVYFVFGTAALILAEKINEMEDL